jgi:hypothetical protein
LKLLAWIREQLPRGHIEGRGIMKGERGRRSKKRAPDRMHPWAETAEEIRPLGAILLFGPRNALEEKKQAQFMGNQARFVRSFSHLNLGENTVRTLIYQSLSRLRISESSYRYAITRLGKPVAGNVLNHIYDDVIERSEYLDFIKQSEDLKTARPRRKPTPKGFLKAPSIPPGISSRACKVPLGKGIVHCGLGQTRKVGSNRSPS